MAKLIVIEDELGMQDYFRVVLSRMGHELLVAENGSHGIELVRSESADLIISDLNMPGEPNGMDLVRVIRELCPDTPMIVVSGFPTEERINGCQALGIDHFLAKPFEMSFFTSIIESLLEENQVD
jgi:DNA-binding NtrC family response regulator